MIRNYLEMNEILTEAETLTLQPQTLRIEVAGKAEAIEKSLIYESLFTGKNYVKQLHICGHEDGVACIQEALNAQTAN